VSTRRLRAFQAAQGLLLRQFRAEAQVHFFEVVRPHFRGLLGHGLSRHLDAIFGRERIARLGAGRAHRAPPCREPAAHASSGCSLVRWNSARDFCSASRYIAFRCTSTEKSTLWALNSGPSTQANSLLPSIRTRHPPHMPVPSIMIGFRLTTV